jgi:very-short-patch-repair endonuclease
MYAPKKTVSRARDLRRRLTLPEVLLWGALRGRRLGDIRFRRQHPVGPFILDFYCEAVGLAVEIDGAAHDHPDQARHDARRTDWLAQRGVTVMRISARAVLDNMDGVLVAIRERVLNPPPSGEVARRPSRRDGGG